MRLVLAKITDSIHETFVLCCQSISPSLPSSFWVPFRASHSHWRTPPTLNMFVLLLLLCIKPDWQFFFSYFNFLSFPCFISHALFPCFISHFLSFPCLISMLYFTFSQFSTLCFTYDGPPVNPFPIITAPSIYSKDEVISWNCLLYQ